MTAIAYFNVEMKNLFLPFYLLIKSISFWNFLSLLNSCEKILYFAKSVHLNGNINDLSL